MFGFGNMNSGGEGDKKKRPKDIPPFVIAELERMSTEVRNRVEGLDAQALVALIAEAAACKCSLAETLADLINNPKSELARKAQEHSKGEDNPVGGLVRSITVQSFMAECSVRVLLDEYHRREDNKRAREQEAGS